MGFDKKKIKQIRQLMLLAAVLILGLIYNQDGGWDYEAFYIWGCHRICA